MSSVQPSSSSIAYRQDMPPKGGYKPVQITATTMRGGPTALAAMVGIAGIMGVSIWMTGRGNQHRRALKKEKQQAQLNIIPLLQAEADLAYVKEKRANLEEEAKLMKNVPGWKVGESVYNTGKWVAKDRKSVV